MSYGENGTQLTMPVMPAGGMGGYGMGGFGGDGWWGILLLIAIMNGGWGGFGGFGGMGGLMGMWPFMFGGFGNGFGSGSASAQGALTREQACIDQNFNNLGRTVEGIASAVNQGFTTVDTRICQQQYETARQVDGVNSNMMAGFNAANVVALQNANALQSQISGCCCDLRTGQMQTQNAIGASIGCVATTATMASGIPIWTAAIAPAGMTVGTTAGTLAVQS